MPILLIRSTHFIKQERTLICFVLVYLTEPFCPILFAWSPALAGGGHRLAAASQQPQPGGRTRSPYQTKY